jgi:hypothetical protein
LTLIINHDIEVIEVGEGGVVINQGRGIEVGIMISQVRGTEEGVVIGQDQWTETVRASIAALDLPVQDIRTKIDQEVTNIADHTVLEAGMSIALEEV